ncbi:TonB-dependent siderophore receptor [Phyllobacterium sp. K27]
MATASRKTHFGTGSTVSGGGIRPLHTTAVVVSLLACASVSYSSIAVAQTSPTIDAQRNLRHFSIPAQSMRSAIDAFIRMTGWQVGYSSLSVTGKTSRAVIGEMTPAAALAKLVDGTGVSAKITGPSTAALVDNTVSGASASPVAEAGTTVLETIVVQGQGDNAWGPVQGYVAKQSATGTKTDTPLIETPQSISVVGRQQMEDRGVQTVGQAIGYTPGVKADLNGAVQAGTDSYILRGFPFFSSSNYLDGLYSNGWVEPYGTERIEVIRGPASVLYGQSNPGGLLSVVSKRPTDTPIREVGVLTSEYGGIQGFFDVGGKVDEDGKFLYRLTGLGKNLGTEYDNGSEYQRVYIAPAVTWRPNDDTQLTIFAKYQYDPHILTAPSVPAVGTIFRRPDGFRIPNNFYGSDPSYDAGSYRRQFQIGYAFEHRFNDIWTVRQNLRYEQSELNRQYLNAGNSPTTTIWNRSAQHIYERTRQFAVDTNAEAEFSTGPFDHTALFGIDYRQIASLSKSGWSSAGVPPIDITNPRYDLFSGPAPAFTEGTDQDSWQTGIYAQDQIKWGSWTLIAGGRYDWAESKTYNVFDNHKLTNEMDQHAFTGRVGVVYEFSNGIAPYFSYAESFEPQSGTSSPARGSQPFEPTTGRQYEVGIKYQPSFFDGFFTVALYDLRKQNVVTTDPDNTSFSVQTGEIASRGIELSGAANVTDDLRFIASYSYVDNEVTKANPNFAGVSTVGKSQYAVPAHQASAWLDYTFSSGPLEGLGLGGGVRYIGSSPGDQMNTFYAPATTLFDAALRYDFGKKFRDLDGLHLSVNATNLFNKEYITTCYSNTICNYGSGRTITGALTYRW